MKAANFFKYLGRVLTTSEDDWPAVVNNIRNARRNWAWFSRFSGQEGANTRISGTLYKAVIQGTLLFGL